MTISELFDQANELELLELQALIMFLVLEKKVLTFEDDTKELDLYFLDKHTERMGQELTVYMEKMNMNEEKPCVWKVYTNQKKILYVYTANELQAKTFAITMKYEPLKVSYVHETELMTINNTDVMIGNLTIGKNVPHLIGIQDIKNYKSEWIK